MRKKGMSVNHEAIAATRRVLDESFARLATSIENGAREASQDEFDEALAMSARIGATDLVQKWVSIGANPLAKNSLALKEAAEHGHLECVKLLLPLSDPLSGECFALKMACHGQHRECAELLAKFASGPQSESFPLRLAASCGWTSMVQELIGRSNPADCDSDALYYAAKNGHIDCVELLLPLSNPKAVGSRALLGAAREGRLDCVQALLGVSCEESRRWRALREAAWGEKSACIAELLPLASAPEEIEEALFVAAKLGSMKCVQLLISRSALSLSGPPSAKGVSASTVAREGGHVAIAELLGVEMERRILEKAASAGSTGGAKLGRL